MGNVYYYFKTKTDLIAAVIDLYRTSYESMVASLERRRTPKTRLRALVTEWVDRRENLARHGCPIGTLCTELSKQADLLGPDAAALLTRLLGWIEEQFRAMGRKDAAELAIALLASYEGVAVLADALNDPSLIVAQGRRLQRWIDSLA
jgi:AcrR family transcriptional regulator